ncbi:hypothetical protein ACFVSN_19515 [Kitasatospora sp. NPDC057904]|uniref:hypothetical protein n=1 Tax=Kitasatospora sp. NPDC057904 TaxID=3346275 RepID=UPI0036D81B78
MALPRHPATLLRRAGRRLGAAATLLSLAVATAGLGAAPSAAAAASAPVTAPVTAPVPANLTAAGPFRDSFQQDPALDTDPLYGLSVGLDRRQNGVRTASWTRVSGRWDTTAAPPPYYVQTSHPAQPNRMVFSLGVSAVMLGAPAVADQDGRFTVSTVVDPVVGDTASADWASIVLSRSHRATGYVTNSDVDLGFIVSSSGKLSLFHGGGGETPFWTGTVPAADKYAVSLTVSSGADRALALTVNGTVFPVTAPAGVNRWPSSAFLYLGAYLSDRNSVTTFGDGAGTGVNVSRIDASATAGAKPFVDTFDGSPAGGDHGLNDDLSARQPTVVSANYTAVSGVQGLAASPPTGSVRVNDPVAPNALSFPQGTAAVRLDKPATADLSGTYTVHARLTPAVGSTGGTDAASLLVSNGSGSTGAVDARDVALGLQVQAGGALTLYQGGRQLPLTVGSVTPASDTYDVSLALAAGTAGQATVTVNGTTVFAGPTPAVLPRDGYVYLGSRRTTPGAVGTADDLRVTMLGGLDYYGYFDIMDPRDNIDHSPEVAPWTNMNNYIGQDLANPRYSGFLDYCAPASCVLDVYSVVTLKDAQGNITGPDPNAAANLSALRGRIGSNLDKISMIYLLDEPYYHGFTPDQVQTEADQVRTAFPDKPIAYTTDAYNLTRPVPRAADFVGFDHYCAGRGRLQQELATLQGALASPDQHLVLFPESFITGLDHPNGCENSTDAALAADNADYRAMAAQNPRIVYLQNFRWLDSKQPGTMPLTTARQQAIGKAVINATPAGPATGVGVYRTGDRTVSENSHNDTLLGVGPVAGLVTGPDDVVLTGHWNGPGTDTVAVYHRDTATFVLTDDNATPAATVRFGVTGDIPLVGDWSGRGRTTVGVYRPSDQNFYLSDDNATPTYTIKYGNPGWTPLVGNWSGTGTTTIGAYDPTTQMFYLRDSNTPGDADHRFKFGNPGDTPVKGDWDGTGIDTVGIYRSTDRSFYASANEGTVIPYAVVFGNPGDIPLTGNWG